MPPAAGTAASLPWAESAMAQAKGRGEMCKIPLPPLRAPLPICNVLGRHSLKEIQAEKGFPTKAQTQVKMLCKAALKAKLFLR